MWYLIGYGKKVSFDIEDARALATFWERQCTRGEIITKQLLTEVNLLKEKVSNLSKTPHHQMITDYWEAWQHAEKQVSKLIQETASVRFQRDDAVLELTRLKEDKAVLTTINITFKELVCKGNTEVEKLQAELNKLKEENKRLTKENTSARNYIGERSSYIGKLRKEMDQLKKSGKCSCRVCTMFRPVDKCGCPCDECGGTELTCNCGAWECSASHKNNKKQCGCTDEYCMVSNGHDTSYTDKCKHNKNKEQCTNSIQESTCPKDTASLILKLQISLKGPLLTPETISYLQGLGWVVATQCVNKKVTDYKLTYVTETRTDTASLQYVRPILLFATMQSLRQAGY